MNVTSLRDTPPMRMDPLPNKKGNPGSVTAVVLMPQLPPNELQALTWIIIVIHELLHLMYIKINTKKTLFADMLYKL